MPIERLIQTTFVLQRNEFVKAQRLVLRKLPRKVRLTGWLQFGLIIVLIVLPLLYQPYGELQWFSLLISFLAWLVLLSSQMVSRAVVTVQFERMDGKEIQYQFDEAGFRSSMADGESRLSWSAVTRFLETDALLVLSAGLLFYTIPKRALLGDDLNLLRSLFTEKMPNTGN